MTSKSIKLTKLILTRSLYAQAKNDVYIGVNYVSTDGLTTTGAVYHSEITYYVNSFIWAAQAFTEASRRELLKKTSTSTSIPMQLEAIAEYWSERGRIA